MGKNNYGQLIKSSSFTYFTLPIGRSLYHVHICKVHFRVGVRANSQPKSSIPIGPEVEISPRDLHLGVKAEREKNFKLLINAEFYELVLAPKLKKGYHQIWEANLQPLGTNVPAFINIMTSLF
jgi:hypothetical protein